MPFKVTMTGSSAELVINGISLELPENHFGALHAWLTRFPKQFVAMVMLTRTVAFEKFKIEEELPAYNEALDIFMEEIK